MPTRNINADGTEPLTDEPTEEPQPGTEVQEAFPFDNVPENITQDTRCGIGSIKPDFLQVFARIGAFVGIYGCSGLLTQTLSAYVESQVTMLEKEFGFSSAETGFIMSCNDIGYLVCVVFAGYVARRVHVPRGLSLGCFMYGMCGILCALPHFLQDHSAFDLGLDSSGPANSTRAIRKILPMCINNTGSVLASGCGDDSEADGTTAASQQMHIKNVAFVLICIGLMLQGTGKSIRSPFVTVYIDDAVDKRKTGFYIGIIVCAGIFGPALGYLVGGLFSKIYVTLEPVKIGVRDPRWIGAWWLGFVVFGAMSLLFSVPIMCFPRYLKSKTRQHDLLNLAKERENTDAANKNKTTGESILENVKDFCLTLGRIGRNFPYMMLTIAAAINLMGAAGQTSFLTKYMSSQYSIPIWMASIVMAGTSASALAIGSFVGGVITRRFRMTPLTTIKIILLFCVISALCKATGFFLGCDQPSLIGKSSSLALHAKTESCVENCACSDQQYFPVCGDDDRSYFSPCHAGCSVALTTDFFNCTCIVGSGHAVAGICNQGCTTNFIAYNVFWFIGKLLTAFNFMPAWIAEIRAVEERDRGIAAAISAFLLSTLGWMPGPVIFGAIIDDTCTLWKYTCGQRQSCYLYDIVDFRNAFHAFGLVSSCISALLLVVSYVYFRVKGKTEWTKGPQGGSEQKVAEIGLTGQKKIYKSVPNGENSTSI